MTRSHTVQAAPGYNSWPMIQSLDSGLVCVYSKGDAHLIDEPCRGVYARCSADGGGGLGLGESDCLAVSGNTDFSQQRKLSCRQRECSSMAAETHHCLLFRE